MAEGEALFLTVSPISDIFVGFQSRKRSAVVITDAVLDVPVVE